MSDVIALKSLNSSIARTENYLASLRRLRDECANAIDRDHCVALGVSITDPATDNGQLTTDEA
jgi:hypothetical protein